MHGTPSQLAAIKAGTYQTDFANIGNQVDQIVGVERLLGPFFKKNIKTLHGFTHGGLEQLRRRRKGADIIANYSENEVRDVVQFTTMFVFLTTAHLLEYLGLEAEFTIAAKLSEEYRHETTIVGNGDTKSND